MRDEHFGQVGGERSGAVAGSQSALNPFRALLADFVDQPAEMCDACMRQGKIWIELDGLLEHLQCIVHIFAARVASAAKVKIVGLRVFRRLSRDGFFFLRRQSDAQSLRDAASDFFLNGEDIFQLAVVAFRPNGMPRGGFHQLRGDAHAVARAADGAFEHVGSAEFLGYLLRRHWFVAEGEHFERGKISSCAILESSVTMSSVIPSRKYSSSFAPLWFSK